MDELLRNIHPMIITSVVSAIVSAVMGSLISQAIAKAKVNKLQNEALRAILKRDILELATKCIARENITSEELETLNALNEAYKNLDGNGFIKDIMVHIKRLSIVTEKRLNNG